MANVVVLYAHPGHKYSKLNVELMRTAQAVRDITVVDLYAKYPRHDIDIEAEQQRLLDNDVIVFQFPLFWYSAPSLLKEWIDLVLEKGFAHGQGGDQCSGKSMMLAVTAADSARAYSASGIHRSTLRELLRPLEQTAHLCRMRFLPPYVLFGSLTAPKQGLVQPHCEGYRHLLEALRDKRYGTDSADAPDIVTAEDLLVREQA